jgi:hypothetical protein
MQDGKRDLSLWHSLAAEIPFSTAIQGRLQRPEHCGTVAQTSELHIESIERILRFSKLLGMLLVGCDAVGHINGFLIGAALGVR